MSAFETSLESRLRKLISGEDTSGNTALCETIKQRGSDKCSNWHNYTPLYFTMFSDLPKDIFLFELGLYHGSSIKAWADYFPNGKIFGADVNSDYLVNERNIVSYICDQRDQNSIQRLWSNFEREEMFDIIIDDGEHEFVSNFNFFVNSYKMLRKGGIFVVEDLTGLCYQMFEESAPNLKKSFGLSEAFVLDIPNVHNNVDNRMFIAVR